MIKNIAWNTFKKTGNIDTFLEFKQIKDIEQNQNIIQTSNMANGDNKDILMAQKVEANGNNKNEWDNNFRK